FGQQGYVRMEVLGDTLLAGQSARKLGCVRHFYDFNSLQFDTYQLDQVVAFEQQGLVMVYVPSLTAFDTLYYMNAVPGDRWQLAELPAPISCDASSWMEVIDTGTTVINSVGLRWLSVGIHYLPWAPEVYMDTIIEHIGSTALYFLPHDRCSSFLDGQEGGPFRCYADAEVTYTTTPGVACDNILGLTEHAASSAPAIYPNPGLDVLRLNWPGARPTSLEIRDAQGRLVLSLSSNISGSTVDVSSLSSGVYTLHIRSASGERTCAKWMKQ
ncbi:MAG TPA: T9SS type A sorting domain-containing protein, partial [Flavobacteriales bacterium]|nr:T9SS type A sorting domain-containing protein [Flavobacteriales bacterium]